MDLYQKLKNQQINLSAIGMIQERIPTSYFCTPKNSTIIGCLGVDGIHYCTIQGLDEMIFAVNPSNCPDDYVHPIARNFEDLLGLLLACGSMDAIEQAHMWDEELFVEYLKENPPTEEFKLTMEAINKIHPIPIISDPFYYIKKLQLDFDYRLIEIPEEDEVNNN